MGNLICKHDEIYKILTDETLNHCRNITGFNDQEILNEHQKFFSVADDGRLKKSHMEELLGDYLPLTKRKHSKYLTNCVFSAIDTNNDGHIDFVEYLMSIKFFQTESPIEKADFVFRIIDKNGDNLVTKKELQRILKCLQEYHKSLTDIRISDVISEGPKPAATTIIEKLDEDKSGVIGVSEFVDGWLKDETIRALFTF
jgi:Ca2+-binding EF-hand superfamily protein